MNEESEAFEECEAFEKGEVSGGKKQKKRKRSFR